MNPAELCPLAFYHGALAEGCSVLLLREELGDRWRHVVAWSVPVGHPPHRWARALNEAPESFRYDFLAVVEEHMHRARKEAPDGR